jgi:hypothetical protein
LVDSLFYADDGDLIGEVPVEVEVQYLLDIYTKSFARVGLRMNAAKTEAMIMDGGKVTEARSAYAYRRLGAG